MGGHPLWRWDFSKTHAYSPRSNHLSWRLVGPIQPTPKVANKHRCSILASLGLRKCESIVAKASGAPLDIMWEPQYDRFAGGSRS